MFTLPKARNYKLPSETRVRDFLRPLAKKDLFTYYHSDRVSLYAGLIATALNCSTEFIAALRCVCRFHDIGKYEIPKSILNKPGALNSQEWEIMKTHTSVGAEIIGEDNSNLLKIARTIALCHHEKWDGSGYPHGCKGADIPLIGRITAIADVFDALTSARPYKPAWPVVDAVREIEQGSGSHFDPALLRAFQRVLPEIERIRNLYSAEKEMLLDHDLAPR